MKRRLQPLFFSLLALFRSAILHAAAGEYDLVIRQGVTTEVIGESASAGPFKGKLSPSKVLVKGESG